MIKLNTTNSNYNVNFKSRIEETPYFREGLSYVQSMAKNIDKAPGNAKIVRDFTKSVNKILNDGQDHVVVFDKVFDSDDMQQKHKVFVNGKPMMEWITKNAHSDGFECVQLIKRLTQNLQNKTVSLYDKILEKLENDKIAQDALRNPNELIVEDFEKLKNKLSANK